MNYISVACGCLRFIVSFRFFSSSLNSLVKRLIDDKHKTLKDLKKEIVGDDIVLNIVNKLESLVNIKKTIEDLKRFSR